MVWFGNSRGVAFSRDKMFYVGPSTPTRGYGKFMIARYARFTNSNTKLLLCLRLHLDFLSSLRSGKKPPICSCAFIRPYINYQDSWPSPVYKITIHKKNKKLFLTWFSRVAVNTKGAVFTEVFTVCHSTVILVVWVSSFSFFCNILNDLKVLFKVQHTELV